jgi:superfamily II DNA/RNA helicase
MRKGVSAPSLLEAWESTDIMVSTPLKFLKMHNRAKFNLDALQFFIMDESDKYFELGMLNQIQ